MHIVMLAAENGALKGGKVGGIGDVIRDVPRALEKCGHRVSVLTPGYQLLARINPSARLSEFTVEFCGVHESLELFAADVSSRRDETEGTRGQVNYYIVDHPLFAACGAGSIYCNDLNGPFATDAHKFALFCAAACELLSAGSLGQVDVVHLHDWHAAMFAVLRRFVPAWRDLYRIPLVYTIHNLSLQGVRPLSGDVSAPLSWFPQLQMDIATVEDPRYSNCINLMRAGIQLSDRIHAVSPSYAQEILRPSDPARGFVGGEGLEQDLQHVADEGRLTGILNGCEYTLLPIVRESRARILALAEDSLRHWAANRDPVPAAHFHALLRLQQWRKRRRPVPVTLTSIGRITDQKVGLLAFQLPPDSPDGVAQCALEWLLDDLDDGELIMLGSGDERHERFFTRLMASRENFLYLRGFSEELAEALYAYGDLFLMPSTYEPCGISQMLAMRAGVPCVVHHVGGLRDTVQHGVNGFTFEGQTPEEQARNMLSAVRHAITVMSRPEVWQQIRSAARSSRFTWDAAVQRYLDELYTS